MRIGEFEAKPETAVALKEILEKVRLFIRNSEGCISCELLTKVGSRTEFTMIEEWKNEEAHKNSVSAFPKEEMQAAVTLLKGAPRAAYYTK